MSKATETNREIDNITVALGTLLTAAIDDELRRDEDRARQQTAPKLEWFGDKLFKLPDPTAYKTATLRLAIGILGQRLFELTKNIDKMREVLERASALDPSKEYRRANIVDRAWNG